MSLLHEGGFHSHFQLLGTGLHIAGSLKHARLHATVI